MPDPKTIEQLRGLVLSALDLKALTDWPDALVEDYLNIVDNLITLSNLIDTEIDKNVDAQVYSMPTDENLNPRLSQLEQRVLTLESFNLTERTVEDFIARFHSELILGSAKLVNLEHKIAAGLYELPIISPVVCHGSCYGNGIGWSQASAVRNTWYTISDADMLDGILHNAEHDGNGKITVYPQGHYLVIWGLSGGNTANDDTTEITISVDGTEVDQGKIVFETDKANAHFSKAGHAIIDSSANAYIEISIRTTDAATPDLTVDNLDIKVILID